MDLAGIGVDIVEIDRIERILERTPSFARRVFTEEEISYCERTRRPAEHYAGRFAAREAVLKALGTGFSGGIGLKDVWVTRDAPQPLDMEGVKAREVIYDGKTVSVTLS